MQKESIIYWGARLIAAIILLQTLYFKFTGSEESVYIFMKVGIEPWGRIGVGVMELITGILLLIPVTVWAGSILGIGQMTGAIILHLTRIGIDVNGDHGYLFSLAVVVLACCIYSFWKSRKDTPPALQKLFPLLFK